MTTKTRRCATGMLVERFQASVFDWTQITVASPDALQVQASLTASLSIKRRKIAVSGMLSARLTEAMNSLYKRQRRTT